MFPYFETIAVIDGKIRNLFFHQKRIDRTLNAHFKEYKPIPLDELDLGIIKNKSEKHKLKISYDEENYKIQISGYKQKSYNKIFLIEDNQLDYDYKYTNRSRLEEWEKKLNADQQIIFVRKFLITDSTISNVSFYDGDRWISPVKPLLSGTMQHSLVSELRLFEDYLKPEHLKHFKSFKFINAMNSLDEAIEYPISLIEKVKTI